MEDSSVIDPSDIDENSIDETIKCPTGIASPANTSTEVKKVCLKNFFFQLLCFCNIFGLKKLSRNAIIALILLLLTC